MKPGSLTALLPFAIGAALLALAACSPQEVDPERLFPDGPDRYARRFLPFEPDWVSERESVALQRTPAMVIWEVSDFPPEQEPTPEQRDAARDFIARCYEAAERHRWFEYERGMADGYRLLPRDRQHYRNSALMIDGAILDPDRPEVLMYYPTPEGQRLAGFMFHMEERFARGPQFGGNLTLWHYHIWRAPNCANDRGENTGMLVAGESCPEGWIPWRRSTEMIHVWLMEHPDGPFGTTMWLDPETLQRGLDKRLEERGW